ncbi:stress responsive alpha-beta barrel domain-containing protein [Chitinophaga caeni]|uniref:Stress responsive alpha-beta barrel domain-containing protein n=1 Tax=Chitinophaga caeni TaxID=2029983 RepID=A0A291QV75_9BACT|nr:Dabb family protein [Chitinophaga caeni]ATL47939.1 stress responsive alpha-beta barrel domain-containing protein [Chitinophaga caeni]
MSSTSRRKFLGTAAALCAGGTAMANTSHGEKPKLPLSHHVFFWLKNPDSIEDRDKLIEGLRTLKKIETVKVLHIGVVASTEKRDVVENSWQVSELMFFKNLEDQAVYQSHPIHLEFIKNYGHLWDKVIVYDTMEV